MAYGLVMTLHVLVSFFLIIVILIQGGRGGMAETLGGSAAQSLFGGGAIVVMTKVTAVGAALFVATCLSLAVLSSQRGRSVMERLPIAIPEAAPTGIATYARSTPSVRLCRTSWPTRPASAPRISGRPA